MATREEELTIAEHIKAELIRLLELVEQAEKNGIHPGLMPSDPVLHHVRLASGYLDELKSLLSAGS
jgi:hypothetical protein